MEENVFETNIETKPEKPFSRGFKFLLGLGIFLTGFMSLAGMFFLVSGIEDRYWEEIGVCSYVKLGITYFCFMCCFAFLIAVAVKRRFFTRFLVRLARVIGSVIMISAFLLPRLPDYKDPGFTILDFGSFVLIDGCSLMFGILIFIFAGIIKEGFSMQSELDEVL